VARKRRGRRRASHRTANNRPHCTAPPAEPSPDDPPETLYIQDAWFHAPLKTDPYANLALLADHIHRSITRRPADLNAAVRALATLARAHKAITTPDDQKHLEAHLTALLNDLGDRILPADRPPD
jgi:hypothetical protein